MIDRLIFTARRSFPWRSALVVVALAGFYGFFLGAWKG